MIGTVLLENPSQHQVQNEPTWVQGNIEPWWAYQHRDLNWINEPFNNSNDLEVWRNLGFTQSRFTGDMYDMRSPEPSWVIPFRKHIKLRHFSWSVYRMRPGDVLPCHSDSYARFCQLHSVTNIDCIRRYVIFLESWQSGHYFEIDQIPIINWQAGQWVYWQGDTKHLAANLGSTDRYTIQITGLVDEDK